MIKQQRIVLRDNDGASGSALWEILSRDKSILSFHILLAMLLVHTRASSEGTIHNIIKVLLPCHGFLLTPAIIVHADSLCVLAQACHFRVALHVPASSNVLHCTPQGIAS